MKYRKKLRKEKGLKPGPLFTNNKKTSRLGKKKSKLVTIHKCAIEKSQLRKMTKLFTSKKIQYVCTSGFCFQCFQCSLLSFTELFQGKSSVIC